MILALQSPRKNAAGEAAKVVAQWGVLGLPPTLRQLAPGTLPPGALVGLGPRGSRYSICPARGSRQSYLITLFTLPRRLEAHPGFTDEQLFTTLTRAQVPYGDLLASYTRP